MTIISDATAQDPTEELFSWFRTKLDTTPVYRDEEKGWQVFGYDDIARILADTTTFSSDTARAFNPRSPTSTSSTWATWSPPTRPATASCAP